MIYSDNRFQNYFSLEKRWYITNGSIIKYCLSKHLINQNDEIFEVYSICPGVSQELNDNINHYVFVELDKKIFKNFMLGKITIDEVLDKIKDNKTLLKK